MKNTEKNTLRTKYINAIVGLFTDEDVAFIASNTINFPIVYNGEEAWIEVTVKMPKEGGDDGYMKRDEYKMKCEENARKAREKEEAKVKKIEKDKEKRKKKEEEKG